MPASDAVIGRVSVKVLPDTSDFRKDTQRKLDAIEKALKLEIKPDLDDVDLLRQVREAVRNASASVGSIEINADLDIATFTERIAELNRESEAVDDINIGVEIDRATREKVKLDSALLVGSVQAQLNSIEWAPGVDVTKLDQTRRRIELELIKIAQLKATITPEMDPIARRRVLVQIDQLEERCDRIKASIEPEISKPEEIVADVKLARLARDRVVKLSVRISKASLAGLGTLGLALAGLRGFDEVFGGITRGLLRLDVLAPKIGVLATSVAGLSLASVSAIGNMLSLGASLAAIAPAALALPGLLIGAAVGLGVFVAALKDFNTIFPDVKAKLSSLQDLISKNFWTRAQAPVRAFIDELFPKFERGLGKVATSAGSFFGALATSMRLTLSNRIGGWFDSIAKSFDTLTRYSGSFSNILGVLGTLGTSLMPRLAKSIGNVATSFSDWLSEGERTGRLNDLVDTAIANLVDLGRVAKGLGGIFGGLARAATAAGGSTLRSFANTLQSISKVVNSAQFQQGLTRAFGAAYDAMERIRTKAGPGLLLFFSQLGGVIEDIGPKVGDTIGAAIDGIARTLSDPAVRKGIDDLFTGIRDAVNLIAPALTAAGPAIGALFSLIGDLVRLIGDSVAQALGYVGPIIKNVADGIRPLTEALNGIIRDVIDAIGPTLVDISATIRDAFKAAADKVSDLWDAMSPFVEAGLKEAIGGVSDVIKGIAKAIKDIKPETLDNLGRFFGKLIELAGTAIGGVLSSLGESLGTLGDNANKAAGPGSAIEEAGKDGGTLDKLTDKTKEVTGELNDGANQMQGWGASFAMFLENLSGFPDAVAVVGKVYLASILGSIGGFFTQAYSLSASGVAAIGSVISTGWTLAAGLTTSTFAAIITTVSGAWNSILAFTAGALSGLVSTVSIKLAQAVTFFAALPGRIVAAVGSLASTLISKGSELIAGFVSGVVQAFTAVIGFFTGLPGTISTLVGNLGRVLFSAGLSVIQGFIDGIKSAFGAVQDVLGSLTSLLPDWKGPADRDAVILTEAGRLVIDGFIDGLESRYDAVRKSLGGLSDDLASTVLSAPQIDEFAAQAAALKASVASSNGGGGSSDRTLNYYAAPGSSLGAEEDLFRAFDRGRIVWE